MPGEKAKSVFTVSETPCIKPSPPTACQTECQRYVPRRSRPRISTASKYFTWQNRKDGHASRYLISKRLIFVHRYPRKNAILNRDTYYVDRC